ncbi:MAG: aminotransferase class I/II-fold pyridoxal phosphate-dependent enzyme [Lachnospiraceae bacterium]|nr:aminotransferase class I/II-fold pyridoxal phosphate-dependent enzyme [Lachnospiraceae bacterium]
MKPLFEILKEYTQSDIYPFHMPGGKRNPALNQTGLPYCYDITEIEGFDDLHQPNQQGPVRDLEKRASKLYGSDATALLVNGSTAGIISGIMACTKKGDEILVARNCHKAVYHGIFLNELQARYLYPHYNKETDLNESISLLQIEQALETYPNVKAVLITSPTFDGVVSDIKAISACVHQKGIPLIVDEAHGAHFGFHEAFPLNGLAFGADIVIHSLHKTLPSLTQTALIHGQGTRVDWERVGFYLQMFQSSSPSYILMASIDVCLSMLENQTKREQLFSAYTRLLIDTRKELKKLKNLCLIETEHFDISKILISVKGTRESGLSLYQKLLEQYHLQMEMAAGSYVLAMTSICDRPAGMERLVKALQAIDASMCREKTNLLLPVDFQFPKLKSRYNIFRVRNQTEGFISVPFAHCQGHISAEFAYLYPPGIPLVVPGEVINQRAAELLGQYAKIGFSIAGLKKTDEILVYMGK